jgi:lactam utilization protein B
MTDHYDKYGEVVARRFNYAQLRIDNIMQECANNISNIVKDGDFELNAKRIMADWQQSGQLIYRSELAAIVSETAEVVSRVYKSVNQLQEAARQRQLAIMFRLKKDK